MAQKYPPTSSSPSRAATGDAPGGTADRDFDLRTGAQGDSHPTWDPDRDQMGARQGSYGQAGSGNTSATGEKAREALDTARSEAGEFVSRQRTRLADRVDSFRQTVDETADRLQQDGSMAAAPARKLSHGLGSLSHALEAGDMEDLGRRMEDFARRNPALFIGGAVALGFLAGRFIKSSGERNDEHVRDEYRSDPANYRSGFEQNRAYQETGRARASDLNSDTRASDLNSGSGMSGESNPGG